MINCPICKSIQSHKVYRLHDDRYGYPGVYSLLNCKSCNHYFIEHEFESHELADMYSNYYPRSSFSLDDFKPLEYKKGFSSWFNGDSRSAFSYVPKNVKVLDIGCGFGESLAHHKSRGCDVYGVEADTNIQRVADKYGFNVKVGLFNPNDYESETFDYVTMDQVLEHVTGPVEVFEGINRILKVGGYLVLSFPNASGWGAKFFGKKWINWHAPYHLHFYSKASIEKLAKDSGFIIHKIATVTSSEWLNYQWYHLMTYPSEGEKSEFWASARSKRSLSFKVAYKIIGIAHKIKLNHLFTRLFDTLGLGDNLVVILEKESSS